MFNKSTGAPLSPDDLISYLNKNTHIYRCPLCKKSEFSVFSKDRFEGGYGMFGYAAYSIKNKDVDMTIPNSPPLFALLICKNCGFIANLDEDVIIKKIEESKNTPNINVSMTYKGDDNV